MRRSWTAVAALAVAIGLAACGADSTALHGITRRSGYLVRATDRAPSAPGGVISLEVANDVVEADGLDPRTATLAASWSILSLSYQTLVTVGPDYRIEPLLATSWRRTSPTRYVFALRRGVRFSNGRAMTAADVVGSLRRLQHSQSVWRTQLGPVAAVRARGAHAVEIDLTRPYTPLLAALANVDAAVMPIKELRAKTFDPTTQMLGTGPFAMTAHRQSVSWSFTRNRFYWRRGQPAAAGLSIHVVADDTTRIADLRSGDADAVELGNIDDPANVAGVPHVRVVTQSTPNFYYLILTALRPHSALADPRVRRAIAIALDRAQIAQIAVGGIGAPTGVVPAGLPMACDVARLPTSRGTLADARALLARAGARGLTLPITIFTNDPLESEIAQVVQQQLSRLGIDVTLRGIDPGSFTQAFDARPAKFDAAISGLAGYAEPGMVIGWWNPKASFSASFMADDPTLDRLIAGAQSRRGRARRETVGRLCARADDEATMIPLATYPSIIGYRTDRLAPTFLAQEGYGEPWREIASFRVRGR